MNETLPVRAYQASRIEDEPILGPVLALPDGRLQPLTFTERLLFRLGLTDAKALEARYWNSASA